MQRHDGGGSGGSRGRGRAGRSGHGAAETLGTTLATGEARWRRAQSARRRRLTRRGRNTLHTLLATLLLALLWWWLPRDLLVPGSAAGAAPLPGVAAAAPPVHEPAPAAHVETPGRAPYYVLERLPVSRAVLDLPETEPGGARVSGHFVEQLPRPYPAGPLRIEYTLDAELTRHVFEVLRKGRVDLGNVVVMEPISGRVLAYAATDPEQFPPTRHYPAASLVKVITAAAALDVSPRVARLPCRYTGSPYRLTPSRIKPPARGREISLRRALATSNNQCLAQLAVHALGPDPMMQAIARFGWLDAPAPAHAAGRADAGDEPYDLGRLGSGLAGSRITPLHAVQLAATLVHGELVAPRWVERVMDAQQRELDVPAPPIPRRVLDPRLTSELREMLVDTTRSGTARRAFRGRGGRPLLGSVSVAGKTGSLSGKDPDGRYEWFIGVAPADAPRIAIATVLVQDHLWWRNAAQIAADVLRGVFCTRDGCRPEHANRFIQVPETAAALASTVRAPVGRLDRGS